MRHRRLPLLAALFFAIPILLAESRNPADYPLRIHIFGRNQTTFYEMRQAEEAKGEGRANLFEGGEPKGIDFQFDCGRRLQVSPGFETYPAKWKKPGQELVILQPEFGKAGSYESCVLKVMVKDLVYVMRNGGLGSEPASVYKQWMAKHDHDPENGKNVPVALEPATGANAAPNPPASTAPGPNPPQ